LTRSRERWCGRQRHQSRPDGELTARASKGKIVVMTYSYRYLVVFLMLAGCGGSQNDSSDGPTDRAADFPGDVGGGGDLVSGDSTSPDGFVEGGGDRAATDAGTETRDARADRRSDAGPGSACWSQADCMASNLSFLTCVAPGETTGCGACMTPAQTCVADSECAAQGATSICEVAVCACAGQKVCTPGCETRGCATWQTCGSDHRCAPKACSPGDSTCPADFACGSAGGCARKSCTSDDECSVACVKGRCYDAAGVCRAPAA
jgi:hypothetical protein